MKVWTVKYQVVLEPGSIEDREVEVYGKNVFEAYGNAKSILVILEKKKEIKKIEVVQY